MQIMQATRVTPDRTLNRTGRWSWAAALCAAAFLANGDAIAEPFFGPRLGAATNMAQGLQPHTITVGQEMGLTLLRDGIDWSRVERRRGHYDFSDRRTSYPAALPPSTDLIVVLNWGNRLYDDGNTPYAPEALAALSDFTRALISQFPKIETLEVGNELNGTNFVRGPLAEMPPLDRARAYVPMLKAVSEAARSQNPDVRILGGAAHSLPGAWLTAILENGGAEWIDALAIHPYTTPAEQFVRQVAVLRRHPALANMPFEVTEFGAPGGDEAADHFLRNYCQFALAGVTRAIWFPANLRGPKMAALATPAGKLTPAGRAFRIAQRSMEGRPVRDAAHDGFGYGCQFGDDVLVLWGPQRSLDVGQGVTVTRATGQRVESPYSLSETRPLVLQAADVAQKITLGETGLVADSYHGFAFPDGRELQAKGDSFRRYGQNKDQKVPLVTLPGQDRRGVPWVPYRGDAQNSGLRLTANTMLPLKDTSIVHEYTAPEAQILRLNAHIETGPRSQDGVRLSVAVNGVERETLLVPAGTPLDLSLDGLVVDANDTIRLTLSANETARGDATRYRFQIWSMD